MNSKNKIRFTGRSDFFSVLKKRVDNYFKENNMSHHANGAMVFKTITILALYFVPFLILLLLPLSFNGILLIYFIMGIGMAGIGMSIMHDAVHNSYSKNPIVNKWMGYSLNLMGGMVYNWRIQHNVLHHTYTNVHGMDDDIADKLVLRFSPHSELKGMHKFQYIYVFFFYSILTLYWVTAKDFVQQIRYLKNGASRAGDKAERNNLLKTIAIKLLYVFYTIVIPYWFFDYSFSQILCGFMLMHAVAGLILGLIFQLAHSVEETSWPIPDQNGELKNEWAIHQINTTANFARNNKLLGWYIGGLNFQVEHHLFPHICHIHYPEISKIVESTCNEYGIPYLDAPSFLSAFKSHFRMLKKFGGEMNLDLAAM